jgi:histidine ammonia-lyase
MAARVNGFARGGAGASLASAQTLVAMLNAGVHPVVPSSGSVGASDLAQMAAIALVAIGGGEAELGGQRMPGPDALQRAGIEPLHPQPKDGLALISANGVSVGHGAFVVARAMQALELADLSAALSLEAMSGNASAFEPAVAAAKGVLGQVRVGDHVRELLRGSSILEPDPARTIQDPISFRAVPQVHGAAYEFIQLAWRAVETELNAMSDNPLVSREERRLIHNNNFHPMLLALSFDALRPALAHVGQLGDRRLSHLWTASAVYRDVWSHASGLRGVSLRYSAAAAYAELRQLANPATLDIPPLDRAIEDHSTGATISVRHSDAALEQLEAIIAVELLVARDLIAMAGSNRRLGRGTGAVLEAVNLVLQSTTDETSAVDVHTAIAHAMRTDLLVSARRSGPSLRWS